MKATGQPKHNKKEVMGKNADEQEKVDIDYIKVVVSFPISNASKMLF